MPALCERARAAVETGDADIVCDVAAVADPDLVTVDALSRLQLGVRRLGGRVSLRGACVRLVELVELTGLRDSLPGCGCLRVEAVREPEQGKEVRRVEEEDDPADGAG